MQTVQEYVPITKAKTKLLDMVRSLQVTDKAIAITQNGVPEAVLISMNKFEGVLETMAILSDKDTVLSLKTAIIQANKDKWVDLDEV
ncbi:MAG: type II toxin-antitoxin system Phd/YefM family antitoxin [Thermodesulfobacteriota bacterium]|nr:type II toxin-antitoxin system Phd/YefM family antitoxin [Thermodesulfobacteriota bacterium]